MKLLNNLFGVGWNPKNAGIVCSALTSLVSMQQGNVQKSPKIIENS